MKSKKMWIILIAVLLLFCLLLSQIFSRHGLLFRAMIRKPRQEYVTYQKELERDNKFPADVTEYVFDDYNVYVPDRFEGESLPVVVNIHGGGLIMGNKDFNRFFNAAFASYGFVVFGIGYPLIPETDVYGQLQAVANGIDQAAAAAAEYDGDGSRVYLTGDSAGAYLALYTAALARSEDMQKAFGVTPPTVPIEKLGLMSGMFYTTRNDRLGLFLRHPIYGDFYELKKVKRYSDPEYLAKAVDLPPIYLQSSTGDYLVSYTEDFAKALEKNDRPHELRIFQDTSLPHAFEVFYPNKLETRTVCVSIGEFFLDEAE